MLKISIVSFSFRKSLPEDSSGNGGGFVFDCRALQNPGREEAYKRKTGKDPEVISYLEQRLEVNQFLSHIKALLNISIQNYLERNFTDISISFGCTGGQHRSVYCAEHINAWIQKVFSSQTTANVTHRDCPDFSR